MSRMTVDRGAAASAPGTWVLVASYENVAGCLPPLAAVRA